MPKIQNRFCQRCGKAVPAAEPREHLRATGPTKDEQMIKICQTCAYALRAIAR